MRGRATLNRRGSGRPLCHRAALTLGLVFVALLGAPIAPLVGSTLRLAVPLASAETKLIGDGIAAIVGATVPSKESEVILRSDVDLRARILLLGRGGAETLDRELTDSFLAEVLKSLIDEGLILYEARRIDLAPPSQSDISRERARLVSAAGGEARLKELIRRLNISESELTRIAQRRARVVSFLTAHLGDEGIVTEQALRDRFESGDHPFVGLSFEDAAAGLRLMIRDERVTQAVADWVRVLRERVRIIVRARYG